MRTPSEIALNWAGIEPVVYFLHAPICGLVKIGYSRMVASRVAEIQALSPVRLELLGVIPGEKDREAELHRQFAHLRSHGEWFRLDDDLRDFIDARTLLRRFNALPPELRAPLLRLIAKSDGEAIDPEEARLSVAAATTARVGRAA